MTRRERRGGLSRFARDEAGAVTVEYVVLCGAVVGFALAVSDVLFAKVTDVAVAYGFMEPASAGGDGDGGTGGSAAGGGADHGGGTYGNNGNGNDNGKGTGNGKGNQSGKR